jgi:hypothetical protein
MDGNISEKQLKFGYWFVTHKILLRNIFTIFLFAVNAVLWGYVLYSFYYTFVQNFNGYNQLKADLVSDRFTNLQSVLAVTKPKAIQVESIDTLPSVDNKLDIVALVKNPNQSWAGKFKYNFTINSGRTETRNGFIFPGQEKFLYDLDVDAVEVSNISITDVVWSRENNYQQIAATRDQFHFSDLKYIPAGTEDSVKVNRAAFVVTNDSNFNFYKPSFLVILRRAGQIVGFNNIILESFYSGKSINAESRWFEAMPEVDQVEVVSDVDYLNDSAYIPI